MRSAPELEAVMPGYHVSERHHRRIHAPPPVSYTAFKELHLGEVPLAAPLFALRSLPARIARRPGLPSRLDQPLLAQMLGAGFTLLGERPGEEIVVGLIGQLWRPSGRIVPVTGRESFESFQEPGFVKAALSFAVWPDGEDTFALTETRVIATDAAAERAFRRYWLVVGPFSGLIRRTWLLAVARRAGRAPHGPAL